MDGRKPTFTPYVANFPFGSWTFTAPFAGQYKFVQWGSGGLGVNLGNSGASCAYTEYTRWLDYGEAVALSVPDGWTGGDTTATFRDGKVVTAGGASNATPGAASGGDVNLPGTAGGTPGGAGLGTGGGAVGAGAAGGSGAPANLPFRGGSGGSGSVVSVSPGGGGPAAGTTVGGDGLIVVLRLA